MTAAPPPAPLDAERLARLLDVSVRLNAVGTSEALLPHIIETAAEVLGCDAASLLLHDPSEDRLRFVAATGSDTAALAQIPVPLEGSVAGAIFREGRAVLVEEAARERGHFREVGEKVQFETRSLLGVPMRVNGRTVGVLEALNKRSTAAAPDGRFDGADVQALTVLADHAAVALQNRQLVASLRRANGRVVRADEAKSRFLALTAHELRTPLAAIHGFADVLRLVTDETESDEVREFAGYIFDAADRMRAVLDTMQEVTALRAGDLAADGRPVDLGPVVEGVCAAARERAQAAGVALAAEPAGRPVHVRADPARLRTAVGHLLDNAVRFTPPGGRVAVRLAAEDRAAVVEVADTGCGLAAHDVEAVFREFYQVEDLHAREHEGLGLGLTVTRGIAEAYGGRVWAESAGLGRGATFRLRLPLTSPPVDHPSSYRAVPVWAPA